MTNNLTHIDPLLTLERVWTRVQKFAAQTKQKKLVLRPKQEQLLQLLRDQRSLAPAKSGRHWAFPSRVPSIFSGPSSKPAW